MECQREKNSSTLSDKYTRAGLFPPRTLTIAITNCCNLHCDHCWPDSQQSLPRSPVPTANVLKLIEEFAEVGGHKLCITGGEPLTHPDWFEVLTYACTRPEVKSVCLQTNGTLLLEKEADMLALLDPERLTIQVSVDGATPGTHNMVRGANSYERTMRCLRLLTERGLGGRVLIAFTEMRHNFGEVIGVLELAASLGVGRVVTGTLVPGGRASRNGWLVQPSTEQYMDLLRSFQENERVRELYKETGNIAALEWYLGRTTSPQSDCALVDNPYVTADGTMYPCTMLQKNELALRRVFARSLAEVLDEGLSIWNELAATRERRLSVLRECDACPGRSHCKGGCMGRAHSAYGDIMAPEDRCSLRRAVYALPCH